jgi:hypothetical protein
MHATLVRVGGDACRASQVVESAPFNARVTGATQSGAASDLANGVVLRLLICIAMLRCCCHCMVDEFAPMSAPRASLTEADPGAPHSASGDDYYLFGHHRSASCGSATAVAGLLLRLSGGSGRARARMSRRGVCEGARACGSGRARRGSVRRGGAWRVARVCVRPISLLRCATGRSRSCTLCRVVSLSRVGCSIILLSRV